MGVYKGKGIQSGELKAIKRKGLYFGLMGPLRPDEAAFYFQMNQFAEITSEKKSMSQAAVYEMAAIMASSNSIKETLDLILETVAGMMKAERAFIMMTDPGKKELFCAAAWGVDNEEFGAVRLRLGEGIAGWVARSGKAYEMQSLDDPRYVKSPGTHRDFRSLLCVPLKAEKRTVGVLGVGSLYDFKKYSVEETKTLTLISSLAAMAIENALLNARETEQLRMLSEGNRKLKTRSRQLVEKTEQLRGTNKKLRHSLRSLEEHVARVKALNKIGTALSSTLNLKTILSRAISGILDMLSFPVETVVIARLDESGRRFLVESSRGLGGKPVKSLEVPLSSIPSIHYNRLIVKKQPVLLPDLSDEPEIKKIFFSRRLRSVYIWPLIARGKVMGCLAITCSSRKSASEEELKTIGVAARQIGISVENARLFEESQDRAETIANLVASISHDVRTPLASIKGYVVSLLRRGERLDPATKEECLKITNSEIDRLTRLLDNLLNRSRLEAGKLVMRAEAVRLAPLVGKVVELNRVNLIKHSIVNEITDEIPDVMADPDHLEQVLNNLLSNAVKYSPSGGKVVLGWKADDLFVRISITDSGTGIPPEERERIFELYHRCPGPASIKVAGTGLGLYITRKLVELQGGRIWVESAPSSGSCFYFTMPRAVYHKGRAEATPGTRKT